MTGRLFDRVAVIVGGASGIGAETARRFAAEGARVVIADRDLDGAQALADRIGDAFAHQVDVTDPDSVRRLGHFLGDRVGSLDVLVNCAYAASDVAFLEASADELRRDLDATLLGPMLVTQALLPTMINTGGGVVLSIGSVNGLGWFGGYAYSAAKAGLMHFTRCLAADYADRGVRACAVAPGTIDTPAWDAARAEEPDVMDTVGALYPLQRVGTPSDIADALLFLASDEARWITGVTLPVEGGIMLTNAFADRVRN
ncbi:SDR family NAD(P)-dependent oxidoreductase [Mariniluteicoccus flavus]